jgi:hypothetical protein
MANHTAENHFTSFFKDHDGQLVIWQWPNIPLIGWAVFKVLSLITQAGTLKTWSAHLSTAFLFTWAYLEITGGASYFRRVLGTIVMAALLWGMR